MSPLTRRAIGAVSGAIIGYFLTGSFDSTSDDREIGPLEGVIVDGAPPGTDVVDDDERIADVAAIRELLEAARDPEHERRTWETDEAEYDRVTYAGSDTELRAAAAALDELPHFEGSDRYPEGTYIRDDDLLIAVFYDYVV